MNYQELTQSAMCGEKWAENMKARIDRENEEILMARQHGLDNRTGIGVGDFVRYGDGEPVYRVAHHWGDSLQLTDGRFGASFYLGKDGYCDFSGGLMPGIDIRKFHATDESMSGPVWFFSQNNAKAHNGFYAYAQFRVWELEGGLEE